jgi:hypothetical protein
MKTRYKILILGCIVLLAISIPSILLEIPRTHTVTGKLTDFIYDGNDCIIKINNVVYSLDANGQCYVQSKETSVSGIVYYQNALIPVIGTYQIDYYIGWRCQLIYEGTHFVSLIFYNY